jgi:hypothetical protein
VIHGGLHKFLNQPRNVTYNSQFGKPHLWLLSPLFYQNLPQALVIYADFMKLYQFIPKSNHLPEGKKKDTLSMWHIKLGIK